ncbi:MAG: diguanylate cyclase [Bdellovibrionales bacterium]|nr:diguanylate cyclase [Bdellovibrionales bacterium]
MGLITARVVAETLVLSILPFLACAISPDLAAAYALTGIPQSIGVLPYTLFLMLCYYAIQNGQIKAFMWSALLAVSYSYLQIRSLPTGLELGFVAKAQLLSVLLPLSLFGFFSWDRVRAPWLRYSLKSIFLFLPFAVALPLAGRGYFTVATLPMWEPSKGFAILRLPAAAIVLFLFSAYRLPLRVQRHDRTVLNAFALLGMVPILYILARHADPFLNLEVLRMETAFCFSGAALLVLYAVFLNQRQGAFLDRLTGLPNMRALRHVMSHLARKYAVATADVDLFDKILRIYGEEEARNLLRFVAKHLNESAHRHAFRMDGHRFSVLSAGKDDFELARVMDSICEQLAKKNFYIRRPPRLRALTSSKDRDHRSDPLAKERLQISLSVGVASKHDRQKPWDVLLTAHRALRRAKAHGGNTIVLQGAGPQEPHVEIA